MFLDQEAEWQAVVDYTRTVMQNPEAEPHWLQVPIRLFNATFPASNGCIVGERESNG